MVQKLEDTIIDHYRITQLLARGGMAKIYKAEDIETGDVVAIKVVHNHDENYYQRFRREVQAMADLQHEHILPALDWGEHEQWYYMVMPYIQYGTLTRHLLNGPLSPEAAGEILTQLASALQYAHEHGIVHRDIKSSNVLMRDKHYAYLADFGLAKDSGTDHSLTQSGYLIGTPEYIAPEMLEGPATPISDTYALGVLLYQMLTGHVPFTGTTPVEIMWKHVQERPAPPSRLNPAIPPAIDRVVLKALEKNPRRRFQSVQSLQQAYQNALIEMSEACKYRDISMRQLWSTSRQSLSQFLRSELLQTCLTMPLQYRSWPAIELQDTITYFKENFCTKRIRNTKICTSMLLEASTVFVLILSLCILTSDICLPHPPSAARTTHTVSNPLRELPMKISILLTLPPTQYAPTPQQVNRLPALKPSLVLKNSPADTQQVQSYTSYNSQDSDHDDDNHGPRNNNGSRANHGHSYHHGHDKRGN